MHAPCRLADAAQHGVGARNPCAGPLAQGVHQEGVEVFDAGAAAEADAEHGTAMPVAWATS